MKVDPNRCLALVPVKLKMTIIPNAGVMVILTLKGTG